ncbi:MAG: haloalkane dehalogenase [Acidimicrobiales bacterium]
MERKSLTVAGHTMSYLESGQGDPIVFLHGNPTSSILWRDIIPHVEGLGRCIAPDLIGMGQSDKLEASGPAAYRFVEHRSFLDQFLDSAGASENVTLVIHDWGSALGFDWAHRHPEAIKAIVYMEAIVRPVTLDEWPEGARNVFMAMRSPGGEEMVLEKNIFVERILPASILRDLTDDEMDAYRAPFAEPGEDRRPTLTWPREIPIDGEPADVAEIVAAYAAWLETADVPKLFVNADPGIILIGDQREYCRSWPNQTEVTVPGLHFIQEDSPDEIGTAIVEFLGTV